MTVHGHYVSPAECTGCVLCTRACPTHALRVRGNLARLDAELCIDCGKCVRVCPTGAARPATTPPSDLEKFRYTVALPSLTLYGQFGPEVDPPQVLAALEKIGFDRAEDMSWMCEMLGQATDAHLTETKGPWPRISVTCPAVVRLIQLRYPSLIPNFVPIESARELSAKVLRRRLSQELGLAPAEIGIFFITPCTAIVNSILNPVGLESSHLDGAISIAELYPALLREIRQAGPAVADGSVSPSGLLWAMAGGEIAGMRDANSMTVRGVQDVEYVFDHIEAGKFQGVDFIEAYICPDGCVSGGLTVEGRYAAQRSIQRIARRLENVARPVGEEKVRSLLRSHFFDLEEEIKARAVRPLGGDLRAAALKKKQQMALLARLPGKNCSACGAPDCATLAEDVVRGTATLDDCVFVKLERLMSERRPGEVETP